MNYSDKITLPLIRSLLNDFLEPKTVLQSSKTEENLDIKAFIYMKGRHFASQWPTLNRYQAIY